VGYGNNFEKDCLDMGHGNNFEKDCLDMGHGNNFDNDCRLHPIMVSMKVSSLRFPSGISVT